MSLVAKMLEEWYHTLGGNIAVNTDGQPGTKNVEAVFEQGLLAGEVQVEGRPADVGTADDVADRHRAIAVRQDEIPECGQ